MLTLNFRQNNSQILITAPESITETQENQNLNKESSSNMNQNRKNTISWFSAILLLKNTMFDKNSTKEIDWQRRATFLHQELEKCNLKTEISKAIGLLFKSLTEDASLKENSSIEFSNGRVTTNFASEVFLSGVTMQDKEASATYRKLINVAMRFYFHKFGFEKSTWTPHNKPIQLKETLSKLGPLLIFGRFGQKFYEEESHPLEEKFLDFNVFGWKKGSKRLSESQVEAIIVIGAWIGKEASRVYFIEPCDSEKKLKDHKIYVISFDNLLMNIANDQSKLFSEIKDDDFDYIPHYTAQTFGKIPLFSLLASEKKHPEMQYDEVCKSTYAYYNTNIRLSEKV